VKVLHGIVACQVGSIPTYRPNKSLSCRNTEKTK
jgi:hypothetical protein